MNEFMTSASRHMKALLSSSSSLAITTSPLQDRGFPHLPYFQILLEHQYPHSCMHHTCNSMPLDVNKGRAALYKVWLCTQQQWVRLHVKVNKKHSTSGILSGRHYSFTKATQVKFLSQTCSIIVIHYRTGYEKKKILDMHCAQLIRWTIVCMNQNWKLKYYKNVSIIHAK